MLLTHFQLLLKGAFNFFTDACTATSNMNNIAYGYIMPSCAVKVDESGNSQAPITSSSKVSFLRQIKMSWNKTAAEKKNKSLQPEMHTTEIHLDGQPAKNDKKGCLGGTCSGKRCCKCKSSSCMHLEKSRLFFLQVLIAWLALCLPGNIVTFVLYQRVNHQQNQVNSSFDASLTTIETPTSLPDKNNSSDILTLGEKVEINLVLAQKPTCLATRIDDAVKCWSTVVNNDTDLGRAVLAACGPSVNLSCIKELLDETINLDDLSDKYQCHEVLNDYLHLMVNAQFWLEGITLMVVGAFGMAGNLLTIIVLRRIDSNTTFNRLLMTLAIVDSLLLIYYVLDNGVVGTFRRTHGLPEPDWYRVSFPYILHPLKGFFLSCSIFMVVAISAERHRAICSPLTHRPAFWPYAVMVFCIACALNAPKFFEFQLSRNANGMVDYSTTSLNEDQNYITFSSWWDELIVAGIIPLSSLVVFNMRIYLKLRASDRQEYRFVGRKPVQRPARRHSSSLIETEMNTEIVRISHPVQRDSTLSLSNGIEMAHLNNDDMLHHASRKQNQLITNPMSTDKIDLDVPKVILSKTDASRKTNSSVIPRALPSHVIVTDSNGCGRGEEAKGLARPSSLRVPKGSGRGKHSAVMWSNSNKSLSNTVISASVTHLDLPETPISGRRTKNGELIVRSPSGTNAQIMQYDSQHFRKRREKSAMILITIVLTFLFCHTFRLVIQAYEVMHPSHSTAEHHGFCMERGRFHVPVAFYVMLSASHLLLVVNSSINFIIYCCVGKSFRAELQHIATSFCRKYNFKCYKCDT